MQTDQEDIEFLLGCQLHESRVSQAIKIREAIANLAGVEPARIRAEYRFDAELLKFKFWGSLDSIALLHELEKCLGITITDRVAEKVPDPESIRGLTVGEWVKAVLEAVSDLHD